MDTHVTVFQQLFNSVDVDCGLSILTYMIQYSKNTGKSLVEAIRITGASSHFESVDAEYHYLAHQFGAKDQDYCIVEQHLICDKGKHYDVIKIRMKNGERLSVFFDITESYTKFVINPQ
jgi:hypothetical protein